MDRGAWEATVHGVAKSQTQTQVSDSTITTTPKDIMHKINPRGYDRVSGGNSLTQKQSSVSAAWVYILKKFQG